MAFGIYFRLCKCLSCGGLQRLSFQHFTLPVSFRYVLDYDTTIHTFKGTYGTQRCPNHPGGSSLPPVSPAHASKDGNSRGGSGQESGEPVAIFTSEAPGLATRATRA